MLQISLDENATPEQVKKAISTIGFFVGEATMVKVLTGLAGDAGHVPAPPAVIVPPAPTAGTPPPPPPPPPGVPALIPSPELDTKGLPWDERIHSGNKTKNQDGSWKARKGVDDNVKAAVVAELRQLYPLPAAAPPAPTAGTPPPPPPPPSSMPEIPAALDRRQPAGDPPPPPAGDGALTFREFMAKVTPLLASGKLTQAQLSDACKTFDLLNVVQLGLPANAPLIPSVWAYVDTVVNQG